MSNQKPLNRLKEKGGLNPLTAAVTGAVIGAGVVAAGIVALKDKKNHDKAENMINNIKNKAEKYIDKVEAKINHTKEEAGKVEDVARNSKQEVKKIWQK